MPFHQVYQQSFPQSVKELVTIWNKMYLSKHLYYMKCQTWHPCKLGSTWISSIPQAAQISPASTLSTGTLPNFSYTKSSVTLPYLHASSEVHTCIIREDRRYKDDWALSLSWNNVESWWHKHMLRTWKNIRVVQSMLFQMHEKSVQYKYIKLNWSTVITFLA